MHNQVWFKVLLHWNSNTLATSCEELTHWKRLWCWEGLRAGEKGDDRGWDGWMASLTWWTWVWVNSRSWWWTGRPGVLQFMGSQRVGHDWATELNWTELTETHITFACEWSPISQIKFYRTWSQATGRNIISVILCCFVPSDLRSRLGVSIVTAFWGVEFVFCF